MTTSASSGGALPAPIPIVLPPARHGYRRNLYLGRATSVYFDRHPANEWAPHTHAHHVQVSAILDESTVRLRWLGADQEWREEEITGPAFWIIPHGVPHGLICPDDVEMVTLFIELPWVAEVLSGNAPEFIIVPASQLASRDQVIAKHSKLFRRLCRGEDREFALYIESIGTVLGTHVLQALFSGDALRDLRAGLPDDRLVTVIRFIDANLGLNLTLVEMAQAANYSEGHFGVLFKRSMGLTPHDYLMRRRLDRARELLVTTDRKELDIAHTCGFSDDTHLTRRCKEAFHCTPKQLRQNGNSGSGPFFSYDGPISPTDRAV